MHVPRLAARCLPEQDDLTGLTIIGPCRHQLAALLEQITAPVSGLGFVGDGMCQGHLADFMRKACCFGGPIPERRSKAMDGDFSCGATASPWPWSRETSQTSDRGTRNLSCPGPDFGAGLAPGSLPLPTAFLGAFPSNAEIMAPDVRAPPSYDWREWSRHTFRGLFRPIWPLGPRWSGRL